MATPNEDAQMASKGSMIRGYVDALRRAGLLEAVGSRVSPATREVLVNPPPASAWIEWQTTDEIMIAIDSVAGSDKLRSLSREAVLVGLAPILRVAIEGFLRLFGTKPSTILSRVGQLTSASSRGVIYEYRSTGDNSGVLQARYPTRRNMPQVLFVAAAGGVDAIFDVCSTKGHVREIEVDPDGNRNCVRLHCVWEPRS